MPQNQDERPALTVAATEEIMRATVMFVDKMRELYGIKGLTLILAVDAGQGRIAMKPIHTGVSLQEAKLMAAYHHNQLVAMIEDDERQQKPENLN